jgi:helix-turn-helix protein
MRPPFPVALVPLLPQFLQRRRAKSDFPLRHMERLGLDRPAYFFAVDAVAVVGGPDGARFADIGNSAYRTTDEQITAMAAAAQGAGLVAFANGRWSLTPAGRAAMDEFRRAVDAHYASLSPIEEPELARLSELLERALTASVASAGPKAREHTPRAARYRWKEPSSAMARLDAAIFGLWQFRDDCHLQAWRDAGMRGPEVHLLTSIWRREATTDDDIVSKVGIQRPEDVRAGLQRLRGDGLLTPGPELGLTEAGIATRERIEAETDRYFFSPWPDDVGREADWLRERLAAVNTALG